MGARTHPSPQPRPGTGARVRTATPAHPGRDRSRRHRPCHLGRARSARHLAGGRDDRRVGTDGAVDRDIRHEGASVDRPGPGTGRRGAGARLRRSAGVRRSERSDTVFQDLGAPSKAWPAKTALGYTTRYSEAGYEVELTSTGEFEPLTAPRTPSVSDQLVTATASTVAGQGGWGVWCRGTDNSGSRRYEFLISHTGAVQIIEPGDIGTGWVYLRGLDLSQPVTLTAHCADVVGAPIELTLVVNGRVALTYRPSATLGPGYADRGHDVRRRRRTGDHRRLPELPDRPRYLITRAHTCR